MIVYLKVEPGIAQIYQARAEELKTTMQELMESVLAFWPAAQWDMTAAPATKPAPEPEPKPEPEPEPQVIDPPFGAGY